MPPRRAPARRQQDPGPANQAPSGAPGGSSRPAVGTNRSQDETGGSSTQAAGTKRPTKKATGGASKEPAAKRRSRNSVAGEDTDAEALAYIETAKPFPEASPTVLLHEFKIERSPKGELVRVSPADAPVAIPTAIWLDFGGPSRGMRTAVALACDSHGRDAETSRVQKAFIETQKKFQPTY